MRNNDKQNVTYIVTLQFQYEEYAEMKRNK